MTDREAFALTLYGEARGEPIEGKLGVASVIANRVRTRYRDAATYQDVCLAHAQFSCWTQEAAVLAHAAETLVAMHPEPMLSLCWEIAGAYIAGVLPDVTQGANHYYAVSIAPPSWAAGAFVLVTLGAHRFYVVA